MLVVPDWDLFHLRRKLEQVEGVVVNLLVGCGGCNNKQLM
jgi:hypothetical protein